MNLLLSNTFPDNGGDPTITVIIIKDQSQSGTYLQNQSTSQQREQQWETPDTEGGYKEGIVRTVNLTKKMGISTHMDPAKPALILGASGMTVLELTAAYGVFANRGIKVEPRYIQYITDKNGTPILST